MKEPIIKKKVNNKILMISGICLVFIILIGIYQSGILSKDTSTNKDVGNKDATSSKLNIPNEKVATGDLKIPKSEVTKTAKFYPYKSGDTYMEVLAVKASDGTIRTAFNTCEVCYTSGKGYYKQEGDELVCQNCGNRFSINQIEKLKNGCNPVPILETDKIDDGSNLVISQSYMGKNINYFSNWKKQ
ncbi:DUF2318 domain-containing protein [Clostridium sp. CF012]|uniref:DUF2318 domain-containing protein n=1 Tax=Clostridium sp. CF012 TaxID=2843319 RepID=UPI001C0DB98D|nr:DUF2318 domain-containing protein [Clostridium sp. CF012]MBU3144717.1 DUF2318 domain-containing protein [Clostridium sp. CF012]